MSANAPRELPSRYEPQAIEPQMAEAWEKADFFKADPASSAEHFSIVIPPPNVTGFLHIGHALNNTLQDILCRWRRMQGRSVLWVPGTDHAGIATQSVVERNLAKEDPKFDRREMGRDKFLERVWEWKEQYGSRIVSQLKRLGCSCDWSRERFTMDEGLSRAVMTVFKRLFDEGLIYRGDYLVNWSTALQTALSDDEVVHKDVKGHLYHIRYPRVDKKGFIQVATTRPETMLGDTAVAVHPGDERYKGLIGELVELPLTGRFIPIIADEYVDREFGTGAVKITPGHDPNDWEMGKRHDLEFINILNPDGTLNENAGAYQGMKVADARKKLVAELDEKEYLVQIEDHAHAVGHCYRSGCVIEPYMSKQWFVKMKPLCAPAIEAVKDGRVEFVPKNYENVYFSWMENVRDWCISRQLWWGHRIPVFDCADCGHTWCDIDGVPEKCEKCGSASIKQDPDVLDTWFSSALWPFSTLGWPDKTPELDKYYPTSVLVTGHDIIFFWVARMIVMGLKFMDEVPFRQVAINAMVMDEHGKKMSKSSGTAIDPLEIIEQYGTDTIRLTMASYPALSRHISLSPKRFETYRNFNNKLWNASRFVMMNTEDFDAAQYAKMPAFAEMELEDRWILSALAGAASRATAALENYEFDTYVESVYKFTWNQYCDWYLEMLKPRLAAGADAESRSQAQAVLMFVLEHILRLLQPVAPFISEAIWDTLRERLGAADGDFAGWDLVPEWKAVLGSESVCIAPWPAGLEGLADADAVARVELIQEAIYRIRNIRGEMGVAPGDAVDAECASANESKLAILREGEKYMRALIKLDVLNFPAGKTLSGFASSSVIDDVTVYVALPEALVERERGRLDKEIGKREKGVKGLEGKLGNEKFTANAPAEVVASERERLGVLQGELDNLKAQRASLG